MVEDPAPPCPSQGGPVGTYKSRFMLRNDELRVTFDVTLQRSSGTPLDQLRRALRGHNSRWWRARAVHVSREFQVLAVAL